VGKTSLIEELIRGFAGAGWAAAKITPHEHRPGSFGQDGFALEKEKDRSGRTDSSRFLVAGARQSFWLQARPERLPQALATLWGELGEAENVVLESNIVVEVLEPTLFLAVIDPGRADFRRSLAVLVGRADGIILRGPLDSAGEPVRAHAELLKRKPQFLQPFGASLPTALHEFLRQSFFGRPPKSPSTGSTF